MNSSREGILKKVKDATAISSHLPEAPAGNDQQIADGLTTVTPKDYAGLCDQFKKELEIVSGEFFLAHSQDAVAEAVVKMLCDNQYTSLSIVGNGICAHIAEQIREKMSNLQLVSAADFAYPERKDRLAGVPAALVDASFAVADVSTLAVLYDDTASSLPHFLPDCIFTVIRPEQLVANLFELFAKLPAEKAKNMVLITGPSRTADVEKILVLGAHGPRRLIVFMLEE